ncbi:hypothetical protein [Bacillus sp. RIT694]|uniref:hypothetical protein n=1 Tax=Bacillus sp. RIT694 TaxID=2666190 RepID=UPI0012AC7228|nr:hypothetical protein [Bacillus sp. RIT694]MRS25920.1 hypothetical protein [Bacillus sp. RIT694]
MSEWRVSEEVIEEFSKNNQDREVTTDDIGVQSINPQDIIAINENYDYPDILSDYKMDKLKKSVEENNWTNEQPQGFCLLMLPDGKMIVNGAGNHRAVLAKELSIESVKATIKKVRYIK